MKPDRSFRTLRLRGRRLRAVPAVLLAGLLAMALPGAVPANEPVPEPMPPAPSFGGLQPSRICPPECSPPGGGGRPPILVVPPVDRFPQLEEERSPLAENLLREVREVKKRFVRNRRTLPVIRGPNEQAHPRQEVEGLIAFTEKDLDQAIARVGEPGLVAMRAWSAVELRRVQRELAATAGHTTASQETITAETSDRFLDQAGEVIGRIFTLAQRDDLEVKLWVGSTPAPQATFRFWSQGRLKGTTPVPLIIRTDGEQGHVLRGLYAYRASYGEGPVELSEQLDLVNGSSFFCCRFSEKYCHHVAKKRECRP